MADLILPDPRMEMPELFEPGQKPFGDNTLVLNKSVPYAENLRIAELCDGRPEVISGERGELGSTAYTAVNQFGAHYHGSGTYADTNSYKKIPALDYSTFEGLTVVSAFTYEPQASLYPGIVSSVSAGNDYGNFDLTSETIVDIRMRAGNSATFSAWSTNLPAAGSDVVVCGTYDKSNIRIYGAELGNPLVLRKTAAQTAAFVGVVPENYIGYYSRKGGRAHKSSIYYALIFDVAIPFEELQEIVKNPYRFFIPE